MKQHNTARALQPLLRGQVLHSPSAIVTASAIKSFGAEFDPQPQHLDEMAAATSQFGSLVASGWHSASLAMRLFVDALPPIPGGAMGTGVDRLRWLKPVRPNDSLRVAAKVTAVRRSASRPEKSIVTCIVDTFNQSDVLVLTFSTTMLVPSEAASNNYLGEC